MDAVCDRLGSIDRPSAPGPWRFPAGHGSLQQCRPGRLPDRPQGRCHRHSHHPYAGQGSGLAGCRCGACHRQRRRGHRRAGHGNHRWQGCACGIRPGRRPCIRAADRQYGAWWHPAGVRRPEQRANTLPAVHRAGQEPDPEGLPVRRDRQRPGGARAGQGVHPRRVGQW
ncbi:hypothetical protein D3C71_1495840 [compost metagenome]